jgi:hypothetical protein
VLVRMGKKTSACRVLMAWPPSFFSYLAGFTFQVKCSILPAVTWVIDKTKNPSQGGCGNAIPYVRNMVCTKYSDTDLYVIAFIYEYIFVFVPS